MKKNQRKTGAILSYVSIIINSLIQLLYTPILIKMLGQSEYGLFSLTNSVIGYLAVLDLGFGNAIIVYTAKYRALNDIESEKKLHGMFKIVFYIIGLIVMLLGLIIYFNINTFFGKTMSDIEIYKAKIMMLILTFNIGINIAFSIYSSIIIAYERFTFQKILAIICALLKPLIMIPLLFIGLKSITMTIVITFINGIMILSNFIYCKKIIGIKIKYNGFDKNLLKIVLGYSIWIFLGTIVDKINWSVDQFVLGAVSGTIAVSIYAVASQINSLFISLSSAVSGVMLPKMSKLVATKASKEEITNEFIKTGRIQYFLVFLMASGLVILGKEFIFLWVGNKYETSYYTALWLILPLCIPLIQNLGLSIMQAMNKYKFRTLAMTIMSIFNVILSIFLAKKYGPVGSAIGTAISLIIVNVIIMNIYYFKIIKIDIIKFWKEIILMTIPNIIPITIIIIMMKFLKLQGIKYIIFYGSVYCLIYAITCYFITMNSYEKGILKKFIKKFR